ncbi:hypothetical protein PLEOSDRAFT_1085623 [Pleurotus ostreatus PC15]|uniref:Uncharacterized protein n=1 Tax=Pleurotus ostreatus (strain PC15) TaxID=1137138 RepID=A0A067N8T5_PLEO1|nr:hypothetical protein PLEOSDRAFT_1085623 [Pleurotus ostreatus PC15]
MSQNLEPTKRIQKKEKEAELGLDDDTKEILGFNDTDSDESDSSGVDSEDEDSDDEELSKLLEEPVVGDRDEGPIEADEESEADWDAGAESDTDEVSKVTVQEALNDPIYVSSLDAGAGEWQCVVCPGKIFKGSKMIDAHRESKAHKRRFTNFSKLAKSFEPTGKASEVLGGLPKGSNHPRQAEDGITITSKSNRASKRASGYYCRMAIYHLIHAHSTAKIYTDTERAAAQAKGSSKSTSE